MGKMIKAIVIACLATVALAEAEADPYVRYSGLGYGLRHVGYGHLGYGHLGYGHLGYGHRFVYGRGRLRPILKPNPRPRLIPTTDMDTLVSDTDMVMDMVLDTVDSDMAMDLDTMAIMDLDTTEDTARGLLMLSLRPRLIHTTDTDTDVDTTVAISDTLDTSATDLDMDMDIDTCTARGLLMLSLRPRLILTTDMDIMVSDTDMDSDMDTMVAISDTATACTAMESKFYNNLSANQQLQLR